MGKIPKSILCLYTKASPEPTLSITKFSFQRSKKHWIFSKANEA